MPQPPTRSSNASQRLFRDPGRGARFGACGEIRASVIDLVYDMLEPYCSSLSTKYYAANSVWCRPRNTRFEVGGKASEGMAR